MPTLSPRHARRAQRTRAALLALALGAGTAAVGCADRITTPPGSLALALAPTALRLTAGRTDSVAVRLLRGGGFDGAIALTLDPPDAAPAGLAVTLDAATLPFPTTESLVRVAAAAGTPPGTYVYDVQATGEGGAVRASRTIAVTVEAAPVPAIGVALDSATLRLPVGATRSTTVTVTRGGGFTGMVLLAVDTAALPRGVRAAFTPTVIPIGATTASLALRADSTATLTGATPFTLLVRASGFGIAERTTSLALTVIAAPAAGSVVSARR